MKANLKYNLDITRTGVQIHIDAYQGDTASRIILFTFSNGALSFDYSDAVIAILYAVKPDGTKIVNRCEFSENGVIATLTTQFTTIAGTVRCQIVLRSEAEILASPEFDLLVRARTSFPIYAIQFSEPADWKDNFNTYYIKNDGGFYFNVQGITYYAWENTGTIVYTLSPDPEIGDDTYQKIGDQFIAFSTITGRNAVSIFIDGMSYERNIDSNEIIAPEWEESTYYTLTNPLAESENEYGALLAALERSELAFSKAETGELLREEAEILRAENEQKRIEAEAKRAESIKDAVNGETNRIIVSDGEGKLTASEWSIDNLSDLQNIKEKVTFLSEESTNDEYPSAKAVVNYVSQYSGTTGGTGDIDCGSWDEETVSSHSVDVSAHTNMVIDGNNTEVVDESQTLEEHLVNPLAHQNMIIDGNI